MKQDILKKQFRKHIFQREYSRTRKNYLLIIILKQYDIQQLIPLLSMLSFQKGQKNILITIEKITFKSILLTK